MGIIRNMPTNIPEDKWNNIFKKEEVSNSKDKSYTEEVHNNKRGKKIYKIRKENG